MCARGDSPQVEDVVFCDQDSALCQTCQNIFTQTYSPDRDKRYVHHRTAKDLQEAATSDCYICSSLWIGISARAQTRLLETSIEESRALMYYTINEDDRPGLSEHLLLFICVDSVVISFQQVIWAKFQLVPSESADRICYVLPFNCDGSRSLRWSAHNTSRSFGTHLIPSLYGPGTPLAC